jgi:hypothetical protein
VPGKKRWHTRGETERFWMLSSAGFGTGPAPAGIAMSASRAISPRASAASTPMKAARLCSTPASRNAQLEVARARP